MGLDDACKTCLVLGLGFSSTPETPPKAEDQTSKNPPTMTVPAASFEPFLTLGLSGEGYRVTVTKNVDENKGGYLHHPHHEEPPTATATARDLYRQASPDPSAVSSFSSGRVKRERDLSSEEVEIEKNSCRVNDEDEDGISARKKLRLTKEQSALLEESFKQRSTLNPNQKQALARQLNLKPRQVEVWFQNRRARTKLKQTGVDCEFLKRCCETLTNENRRLQKELQELKALKTAAQPFYANMPAATLSLCPLCERTSGAGNPKRPFSMPSKPHFYNHVTNPSAAC
ncbi:Homeobox-leucine zipper protein HOX27 [Hibiscus syriacus]|uniref:Homeobox-leucine zipper protein HOX27 n=1 Tax=Hibiscus syriacus TaxID=106335 RepID=A0A6A2ZZD2_HIBSY|nr:homeobox-leucine zipper protein HAT22-like isoform X2 [Hibiscus syriacus]KAE8697364.1 Homeobox-leucine zipper protein HOX27 [Hibiscus syriacus]